MINYPGLLSPSSSSSSSFATPTLCILLLSSMQISKAWDLWPPENILKSAVDVTDVSANDFLELPRSEPPSSDSGMFPLKNYLFLEIENCLIRKK